MEISKHDSLCSSIIQYNTPEKKLRKRDFVYTEEQSFRIYNTKKDFAVVRLGKRKGESNPFLFIKLSVYNACIKQEDIVELLFLDGSAIQLKNKYAVNCDGYIVAELNKKEIEIISKRQLQSFMIYTFQKDYEFHFTEEQGNLFNQNLVCLFGFKM